jgi:hypothetical protein
MKQVTDKQLADLRADLSAKKGAIAEMYPVPDQRPDPVLGVWEDLVAAGLAKSRIQRSIYGDPRIVYTATRKLAEAVLREDEYLNPLIFDEVA